MTKGMRAVFLARTLEEYGNGCHVHISLWKDGENVTGEHNRNYKLGEAAESFIAGIQKNYEALFHFLCPHPNSLRRIKPELFCGAYNFWSIENKEAPIRVLEPNTPGGVCTHFEIKSLDHLTNHYFAMAAIIGMGIYGINNILSLPEMFPTDPSKLSDEER